MTLLTLYDIQHLPSNPQNGCTIYVVDDDDDVSVSSTVIVVDYIPLLAQNHTHGHSIAPAVEMVMDLEWNRKRKET